MRKQILIAAIALAVCTGLASAAGALFPAAVIADQHATVAATFGPISNGATHSGTDVAAPAGTPVFAPAAGRVLAVYAPGGRQGYTGQVIAIDHGAAGRTRFADLEDVPLSAGMEISAGVPIGRVAPQESPHVHVELWRGGVMYDPALEMTLIGRP
jgi:murein DD-endopeptidase MepM/ murein hydrolase activator NlpD